VSDTLKAGEIIDGRYQVERRLGRGSAATVYAARDRESARDVAIKVMRARLTNNREALARFRREADVQTRIQHRNIAALYGRGVVGNDQPYLAIELLRGRSLRDVIKNEAPIGGRRAASYGFQALAGLGAIHEATILHRDLKPANLMLEPSPGPVERVVLIDFGFAWLEGGGRLTATGHVVGSLGYLAPERLLGEAAEPRSDLYSLGVVLFELLAARRPFIADTDLGLVDLHLEAPVPRLDDVARGWIGRVGDLEDVIRIALAKDPRDRFRDAAAMAEALATAAQHCAE
jgi:serine/threonine-protein kinase